MAKPRPGGGFEVQFYGGSFPIAGGAEAVDGLLFATHRRVVASVPFDERTFTGFHSYDSDFSYAAFRAGFELGVALDIPLIHASIGTFSEERERFGATFDRKWAGRLSNSPKRPSAAASVVVDTKAEVAEICAYDDRQ